jgi:hypothetical protein
MAGHIPGARFYLVEGAGHGLHWEAPGRLLAALDACRRDLPAVARPAVANVARDGEAAGPGSAAESAAE